MAKLALVSMLGILAICGPGAERTLAVESEWMIEGEELSELAAEKEAVTITGGTVSLSIPTLAITIECESSSGNGTILANGTDEITLSLSKCQVEAGEACKVAPFTIKAKSTPISTGGVTYAKVEPLSGGVFATIVIESEECALPEKTQLKGAFAAEASFMLQENQPLTFSEAISKTVNKALSEEKASELKLTFGISTASITGQLETELSGEANAGMEWQRALYTKLCAELPAVGQTTCPFLKDWPKDTSIEAERVGPVEMKFRFGTTETTCASARLEGKTSANGNSPLGGSLIAATFTCNNNCAVTRLGPNLFAVMTEGRRNGQGEFQIPHFQLKFVCGTTTCIYLMRVVKFFVLGGKNAVLFGGPETMTKQTGSDAGCAATGVWEGKKGFFVGGFEYRVEFPTPMYLTS